MFSEIYQHENLTTANIIAWIIIAISDEILPNKESVLIWHFYEHKLQGLFQQTYLPNVPITVNYPSFQFQTGDVIAHPIPITTMLASLIRKMDHMLMELKLTRKCGNTLNWHLSNVKIISKWYEMCISTSYEIAAQRLDDKWKLFWAMVLKWISNEFLVYEDAIMYVYVHLGLVFGLHI